MIPALPVSSVPVGTFQGASPAVSLWLGLSWLAVVLVLVALAYMLGMRRGRVALAVCLVAMLSLSLAPFALAQTAHGINWTWTAVTKDINGNTITATYDLSCGTSASGPFTRQNASAGSIAGTSFLVPSASLTQGTTYFCEVLSYNGVTPAASQSPVSAGVLFQYPAAPVASAPSGVVQ